MYHLKIELVSRKREITQFAFKSLNEECKNEICLDENGFPGLPEDSDVSEEEGLERKSSWFSPSENNEDGNIISRIRNVLTNIFESTKNKDANKRRKRGLQSVRSKKDCKCVSGKYLDCYVI